LHIFFLGEHCDSLLGLPAYPVSDLFVKSRGHKPSLVPGVEMKLSTQQCLKTILLRLHNACFLGHWCERRASLKALAKIGLRLGEPVRITVYQLLSKMKMCNGERASSTTTDTQPRDGYAVQSSTLSPVNCLLESVASTQANSPVLAPALPAERGNVSDILDPVLLCLDLYYASQCAAQSPFSKQEEERLAHLVAALEAL